MARDRKRAKQRRDRARRAPAGAAVQRTRRDTSPPADPDLLPRSEPQDLDESPRPLEHASADADLVDAQMALGRSEFAEPGDTLADEEVAPDELDEAADRAAGSGNRGGRGGGREVVTADGDSAPAPREAAPVHRSKVLGFLQASWRELHRVQWPDRRQVAQATGVVLAFVIIAGLFLGAADLVFQRLVDAVL